MAYVSVMRPPRPVRAAPLTVALLTVALLTVALLGVAGCAGRGPRAARPAAASTSAAPGPAPAYVRGFGDVGTTVPACSATSQRAPALPGRDVTTTEVPGSGVFATSRSYGPFGVAVSPDSRWAFVSSGDRLDVFRISAAGLPALARTVPAGMATAGNVISPGGQYLLAAADRGALVFSTAAAERGSAAALLGGMETPGSQVAGPIEVAVTPSGRFAFVSLEDADAIAVFSLRRALAGGFGPPDYIGSIPTQLAPVGLAISPDGRWLYSTSEGESAATQTGTLSVISVARAQTDPAAAVVARVAAGCSPVRVVTSADGGTVWVTARASDALLAFSAARLRTDPSRALLADVPVGELPVGLALVRDGSLIVVADSDRFDVPGANASLAVVDVADALAGRPALLGYLPAGRFPRDMAAAPDGRTLLIANFASRQLEAVDLARLP
jgi:DNA-binding beta-propeller fold protein YncE